MTASDYNLSGYEISKQVSDEVITRAENDVLNSYVIPIIGETATIEDYKCEVMALAYCLMLRRNITKTRFGSEIKNNQYGTVMQYENAALNTQIAGICKIAYKSLISKTTLEAPFNTVTDIIDSGFYKY